MKKSTKIVTLSIIALFIATVCLWFLTGSNINREGGGEIIVITENGETVAEVNLEYIRSFDSETFETVIRSSINKPEDVEYTGVLLKSLIEGKEISLDDKTRLIVKGLDGYMTAISIEEFEKKDIYIAYEMNKKPIKPREQNGYGPFQLVIPGDPFSQRWCKFVCEVEIK